MKLDGWRDPYIKDTKFAGELVSSRELPRRPRSTKRLLKYGTGCASGGPDCFNCCLPACTWQTTWGDRIDIRSVEVT